jgi:hypothetical protein
MSKRCIARGLARSRSISAIARGRERQHLGEPASAELRLLAQGEGTLVLMAPRAAQQEHELREQQLFEGQALTAALAVVRVAGKVHRGKRPGAIGQ